MRPIDADALKRKAQKVGTEAWIMKMTAPIETTLNQFIDWIDNAPSIDIVRCKECRYELICNHSVQHTTHDTHSVTIASKTIEWCSYGERREP